MNYQLLSLSFCTQTRIWNIKSETISLNSKTMKFKLTKLIIKYLHWSIKVIQFNWIETNLG